MWIAKKTMQLAQGNVLPGLKFVLESNTNLSRSWKRPEVVAFPKVWRRWTGRLKVADSTPIQFRVQDVPEELQEQAVQHMCRAMRDEPMCAALGLWDEPASARAMEDMWREMLRQRVSLVALVDDPHYLRYRSDGRPVVAGVNMLGVVDRDSFHYQPKFSGERIQIFMEALSAVEHRVDVFARYGVDTFLTGMGLAVAPEFRGLGVGTELLRARLSMGRKLGIPLTVTMFSAPASHQMAHTVGMELLAEVPYERVSVDGHQPFKGTKGSMRLMGLRVE